MIFDEPTATWKPNWNDVLARAEALRRRTRRRILVSVAILACVVIPVTAFGEASDWWFASSQTQDFPGPPDVVAAGVWKGHAWQLRAYVSHNAICRGLWMKPDYRGASCGPREPITYSSGSGQNGLTWIIGSVTEKAARVRIDLGDGNAVEVPASPARGIPYRFYASQLPNGTVTMDGLRLKTIAGLDEDGKVVACMRPSGPSPLSACS
jgi:hypothetical protein